MQAGPQLFETAGNISTSITTTSILGEVKGGLAKRPVTALIRSFWHSVQAARSCDPGRRRLPIADFWCFCAVALQAVSPEGCNHASPDPVTLPRHTIAVKCVSNAARQ
jgi:hypothetical protein